MREIIADTLRVRVSRLDDSPQRQIHATLKSRSGLGLIDAVIIHEPDERRNVVVRTVEDIEGYLAAIRKAAADTRAWIAAQTGDPLELLRRMKFETVGFHPVDGHALNVVEQINQTWTYAVALAAARQLLDLHPEAGGYRLAPGANASSQPLDIMSLAEGLVGAETFASVHPRNNGKMAQDLEKLAARSELHRYVFFSSPRFPGARRVTQFERDGVQVWSVDV